MKPSLPPKLVEILVWVSVISFCKTFVLSSAFDALLCRNWPFSPPNCLTLWITLMYETNNNIGHWDGKCYCRKMLEIFYN